MPYNLIHDHLHSPVALLHVLGSVMERYEYDAYGNPTIMDASYNTRNSSNYGNNYLFTGRSIDILDTSSLKIQHNRHRILDYYTGRWFSHDPMGYEDGMSLYEYVLSNPIAYTDSFGLEAGGEKHCMPVLDMGSDFTPPPFSKKGLFWAFGANGNVLASSYGGVSAHIYATGIRTLLPPAWGDAEVNMTGYVACRENPDCSCKATFSGGRGEGYITNGPTTVGISMQGSDSDDTSTISVSLFAGFEAKGGGTIGIGTGEKGITKANIGITWPDAKASVTWQAGNYQYRCMRLTVEEWKKKH